MTQAFELLSRFDEFEDELKFGEWLKEKFSAPAASVMNCIRGLRDWNPVRRLEDTQYRSTGLCSVFELFKSTSELNWHDRALQITHDSTSLSTLSTVFSLIAGIFTSSSWCVHICSCAEPSFSRDMFSGGPPRHFFSLLITIWCLPQMHRLSSTEFRSQVSVLICRMNIWWEYKENRSTKSYSAIHILVLFTWHRFNLHSVEPIRLVLIELHCTLICSGQSLSVTHFQSHTHIFTKWYVR